MTRLSRRALLATATMAFAGPAIAQTGNEFRIVVGFPPGGGADALARFLAERLAAGLGRAVLVDNRPGAGGQIAARHVKGLAPDAPTLMMGNDHQMVTVPLTMQGAGYVADDFAAVAHVAEYRLALTVNVDSRVTTVSEYLASVRPAGGAENIGVPAPGSLPQFMALELGRVAGVTLNVVTYRGGAPLQTDLLGGHIPASVDALGSVVEFHRTGRLRVLAVSGSARSQLLPGVPTFAEAGIAGLERGGWVGAYGPPNAAPAMVAATREALRAALADESVRARMATLGFEARFEDAPFLRARAADDTAYWDPVIRRAGLRV